MNLYKTFTRTRAVTRTLVSSFALWKENDWWPATGTPWLFIPANANGAFIGAPRFGERHENGWPGALQQAIERTLDGHRYGFPDRYVPDRVFVIDCTTANRRGFYVSIEKQHEEERVA